MVKAGSDTVLALQDARLTLAGNAGPVEILKGISLSIERGQTVGLVGPSGSGKSSLLMLMGGLERATSGQIAALGQDLTGMDEDQLARFRRGRPVRLDRILILVVGAGADVAHGGLETFDEVVLQVVQGAAEFHARAFGRTIRHRDAIREAEQGEVLGVITFPAEIRLEAQGPIREA